VTKLRPWLLGLAILLSACGGAGSGGTTPTAAPAGAGTDAPKQYPGKTASPSASGDGYYGY
jgi:hypothetical protein